MRRLNVLTGHTGIVNSVIYLYNGYLASGSADNSIRIWKWFVSNP